MSACAERAGASVGATPSASDVTSVPSDAAAPDGNPVHPGTASAGDPADEPYSASYAAGGRDSNGTFLGGTEAMNLTAFGGRLYAGVGYWMDVPNFFPKNPDPASGAQLLVLDGRQASWRLEQAFAQQDAKGRYVYSRLSSMGAVQFHDYDAHGRVLGVRKEMLVVGLDGIHGAVYTQTSQGTWADTQAPSAVPVRAFAVHRDPTENVDKLYVGTGVGETATTNGAIYSGVFNAGVSGGILWNPVPEFAAFTNRVMSVVDCGGKLFFAAKPSIYRLNDQTKTWDTIYSYPMTAFDMTKYVSGFRGLTCIDDPGQPGHKTILSAFEGSVGDILRIDPDTGSAVEELNSRAFLTTAWGPLPATGKDIIAGYNDIPFVEANGGQVGLFGLLVNAPGPTRSTSAWFLSRSGSGATPTYQVHEIKALAWPHPRSDGSLWSVRTMTLSPFAEDQGMVLYIGGYDGHFMSDHNTAWIYRVGFQRALGG
jgi:hypothetical protein